MRTPCHSEWQSFFDGLSEGVLFVDGNGVIVSANLAALNFHGVCHVGDLGENAADYRRRYELRYRDNTRLPATCYPLDRLVAEGACGEITVELHRAGGSERLGIHRVRSLSMANPEQAGDRTVLIFENITARVCAEERFERIFRLMPVPGLILAQQGFRVRHVNDAFETIFGYVREEVVGCSALQLGLLGDLAARHRFARQFQQTGLACNDELRLETKEGGMIDCLVSAGGLTLDNEPCLFVVAQDVTEHKRTETDLLDAIEAVMQDASWFGRMVIEKLANIRTSKIGPYQGAELSDLTLREKEVLGLICQGCSDKEMATELNISAHTIRNHVSAVYAKLDVHKRGAVIVWARERGFTGARMQ